MLLLALCETRRDRDQPDQRCRQGENVALNRRMTSVLRRVPANKGIGRIFLAFASGFRSWVVSI